MPTPASSRFFIHRTGRRIASLRRLVCVWLSILLPALSGCSGWLSGAGRTDRNVSEARPDAAALYARGLSLQWSGDPESALVCFRAAQALDPAAPLVLERIVETLTALERPDEAILALDSAADRHPESAEVWMLRGRFRLEREEWDAAARDFERAIALEPESAQAASDLSHAYLGAGRAVESLRALDSVWAAGTERERTLSLAGVILAGNYSDEAREAAARLLRERVPLDRASVEELCLAYRLLSEAGETEVSAACLQRAADLSPERDDLKLRLALTRLSGGDRAGAVSLLEDLATRTGNETSDVLRLLAAIANEDSERAEEAGPKREALEVSLRWQERLRAREPDSAEIVAGVVHLQLRLGRLEDALAIVDSIPGDQPGYQRGLAELVADAAGEEPVRAGLERWAAERPDLKAAHLALGQLALKEGRPGPAAEAFGRALRGNGAEAARVSWCVAVLLRDGSADAAREELEKARESRPGDPLLLELRANLEAASGRFEEAAHWIERAAAEVGSGAVLPTHFNLKRSLFLAAAGRSELAREILSGVWSGDGEVSEDFMIACFNWCRVIPDVEPIRRLWAHLRAEFPGDVGIPIHWAILEEHWQNPAEGVKLFREALQAASGEDADPERLGMIHFLLGMACDQVGQPDEALANLARSLELNPGNSSTMNSLAYLRAVRGEELDSALELARAAVELEPDNGAYLDTLAWVLYRRGALAEAKTEILRALERKPAEPAILDHAGDILDSLKEPEAAAAYWKKAFLANPKLEGLAEKLAARGIDPETLRGESAGPSPEAVPYELLLYDLELQGRDSARDIPAPETKTP